MSLNEQQTPPVLLSAHLPSSKGLSGEIVNLKVFWGKKRKKVSWEFPAASVVRTPEFPLLGIQSLVGELRSHRLHSEAKKIEYSTQAKYELLNPLSVHL